MAKRTPGQPAKYQRAYREACKAAGLCTSCGTQPAEPGKTKCAKHLAKLKEWWAANPEYARANQRAIRERRNARTDEQVQADRERLRPDGVKFCKKRAAHSGALSFGSFFPARGEADGLHSLCKACDMETYKRRAEKYWKAQGIPFACVYCGGPYEHVDHVVPRKHGGTDDVENLVPACQPCNQSKNSKPLDEWLASRKLVMS